MKVELRLSQTDLFVNETTSGVVSITNDTNAIVIARDPLGSRTSPVLRVTDLKDNTSSTYTQVDRLIACDPHYLPGVMGDPAYHFKPDERVDLPMELLHWVGTLRPGRYSVQAMIVEAGNIIAKSNSVEVRVRFSEIGFVQTQPFSTGLSPIWFSAGTQFDDKGGCTVLLRGFEIDEAAWLEHSLRVGTAARPVYPVISVPHNGMFVQGHWLAWIEGADIVSAYVDDVRVVHAPRKVNVTADAIIVAPLFHALAVQPGPGAGSGFMFAAAERRPVLRALLFPADGSNVQIQNFAVPDGEVVWSQGFHLSNRDRSALWIGKVGNELKLHQAQWPLDKQVQLKPAIGSWTGNFIAAGAALDEKNVIHGALLAHIGPAGGVPEPTVVRWTVDPEGKFTQGPSRRLDWPAAVPVGNSRLRVHADGEVWVLMSQRKGPWVGFAPDGSKFIAVGGDNAEIVFAGENALVQSVDPTTGFRWWLTDGHPFKSW